MALCGSLELQRFSVMANATHCDECPAFTLGQFNDVPGSEAVECVDVEVLGCAGAEGCATHDVLANIGGEDATGAAVLIVAFISNSPPAAPCTVGTKTAEEE